jgi:glyoxylase-like metal-dependent hydrolase (beta-lactamase superfamily II)
MSMSDDPEQTTDLPDISSKQVHRVRTGDATITLVSDGRFRLDGGAMFGVVPRVVWEQQCPPDAQHRIQLAFNAMLVELRGVRVLIDPGLGTRYDARFRLRYAVEQPPRVVDSLRRLGVAPESIDFVVDTHLHWDHAGANTAPTGAVHGSASGHSAPAVPAFPKAKYVIQRREWEDANHPHERNQASYRADDFVPVASNGQLQLVDGDVEIAPGIRVLAVGGHSAGMQVIRVDSGEATFLHLADLVPTRHHLQYPWIMGYDLYPVETLTQRKQLLPEAAAGEWVLGFVHDPEVPFGSVRLEGGRPVFAGQL